MTAPTRYDAEERDRAYRAWRESEYNVAKTLRRLVQEEEWPLSRQTLFEWRDQYHWLERAAAEDAEAERRTRAEQTDRLGILSALEMQRHRYDTYFATLAAGGEVDPKATAAYTGLARVILEIKGQIDAGAGVDRATLAGDVLGELTDYVSATHPEHAEVLGQLLPGFAAHLAKRLGA
jgi:hypothetical protein